MSINAYSGAAGCGKTYSLFEHLNDILKTHPLAAHQQVLAITFMHGARYRLNDQLSKVKILKNRFEASTLDSLAWTICRRWTSRIIELGLAVPVISNFDEIALIASKLLSYPEVGSWVTMSYPIIIVDEAQDLEKDRLMIVEELMKTSRVLLAYDYFQCLNTKNRPVAITTWIAGKCTPTELVDNKRTRNPHLLKAALQVRSGQAITVDDVTFKIKVAPHRNNVKPTLAATHIAYQFFKPGTFAILAPTKDNSAYVKDIVNILQTESLAKDKLGPFTIAWEDSVGQKHVDQIRALIKTESKYSYSEIKSLLEPHNKWLVIELTLKAVKKEISIRGFPSLTGGRILEVLDRQIITYKQYARPKAGLRKAMTIHQAKNREFDNIVIIWPFQVPSDIDYRRRILYNAITRAKKTCLVIVQNAALIKQAPFV